MNSNNNFIKTVLTLVFCAALAGCGGANTAHNLPTQPTSQTPQASKPVDESNLAWQLVNGQRKRLADYKGQAVVLDFWATYCPPCEEGIPHLVELHEKHKADGLNVVGLHVGGAEDRPKVAGFVRQYRMSYSLGYPEDTLSQFYLQGDTAIPQTIVIDRKGQLVQKFVGFTPEIKADLDKAIATALAAQ